MKPAVGLVFLSCLNFCLSWSEREDYPVRHKRQSETPRGKRVVCYHTSWSAKREESKFLPSDIDPFLCTHLLYAYASPDIVSGVVSFDANQDEVLNGYRNFTSLKQLNPNLHVILSMGGGKEGSAKFSRISGDPRLRTAFAENTKAYLDKFNFTGLDIVWKYPNSAEGSSFADKQNYVLLLQELRRVYQSNYTISIAVPPFEDIIEQGFDLDELIKYVDFMTVLTYGYHQSTGVQVYHTAPLYKIPQDPAKELNVDASIMHYIERGVDLSKLNLATNLFGVTFILDDPNENEFGSPVADEGSGTQETGAIIYNQLCKKLMNDKEWTVRHVNKSAVGPYAYKDKEWVSYDDIDMVRNKARYVLEKNLGGIMFWSMDQDDFERSCHPVSFPLIRAAGEILGAYDSNAKSVESNTPKDESSNTIPKGKSKMPIKIPRPSIPLPKAKKPDTSTVFPSSVYNLPPVPLQFDSLPSPYHPPGYYPTPSPYEPTSASSQPTPLPYQPQTVPSQPTPLPYQPQAIPSQPTPLPYQPPAIPPQPTPFPYQQPLSPNGIENLENRSPNRSQPGNDYARNLSPNSIYSNRDVVIFHNVNIWTVYNNYKKE